MRKNSFDRKDSKTFGNKPKSNFKSDSESRDRKEDGYKKSGEFARPSFKRKDDSKDFERKGPKKSFDKDKKNGEKRFEEKNWKSDKERKPNSFSRSDKPNSFEKPAFKRRDDSKDFERKGPKKSFGRYSKDKDRGEKPEWTFDKEGNPSPTSKPEKTGSFGKPFKYVRTYKKPKNAGNPDKLPILSEDAINGIVRLNRYLANAGICSRREADELISSGVVSVNGKPVTELGFKVKPTDIVNYGGQTLKREKPVYVLLNKPKDYITTLDDPQKRKTVLELVKGACKERIYPVGRLDRSTTGLLLLTNDGELTTRLTHPRYGIKKIYHVALDKNLKHEDFSTIVEGLELEDGPIKVDAISFVGNGSDKKEIGIEIHSGRNRIVRRIFEHLGYGVVKLDRVYFAGLTKKDLARGKWRKLSDQEVAMLKMTSSAKTEKSPLDVEKPKRRKSKEEAGM